MRPFLAILLAFMVSLSGGAALADNPNREFLMACTYGTLAGTLVGAASLAFTSRPNENMDLVARGASLGLYLGILLGVYVVYIVPGMESPEEDPVALMDRIPLVVSPLFRDKLGSNIDGLKADWTMLRF